jgi:hypothetical protein
MKENVVIVRGIMHPPAVTDPNYRGMYLRQSEFAKVPGFFRGKPVCLEHDQKRVVGTVTDIYLGPNKELICDLMITKDNTALLHKIRSSSQPYGLSINYTTKPLVNHRRESDITGGVEISIVEKPAMHDAYIIAVGNSKEISYSSTALKILFPKGTHNYSHNRMSDTELAEYKKLKDYLTEKNLTIDATINALNNSGEASRILAEKRSVETAEMVENLGNVVTHIDDLEKGGKMKTGTSEGLKSAFRDAVKKDDNADLVPKMISIMASFASNHKKLEEEYKNSTVTAVKVPLVDPIQEEMIAKRGRFDHYQEVMDKAFAPPPVVIPVLSTVVGGSSIEDYEAMARHALGERGSRFPTV